MLMVRLQYPLTEQVYLMLGSDLGSEGPILQTSEQLLRLLNKEVICHYGGWLYLVSNSSVCTFHLEYIDGQL